MRSTPSASRCAKRSAMGRRTSRWPTTTPRAAMNGCTAAARTTPEFEKLADAARAEVRSTLGNLARFGLFDEGAVDQIMARVAVVPERAAPPALAAAGVIFEGVPEVLELKREVLSRAAACAGPGPIIASTTSTILVDDLAGALPHPERFLNAHWLNPAYLVPLVELSPGART